MSTRIFSIISVLSLLGTLLVAVLLWKLAKRERANYATLANRIIAVTFVTQREELVTELREILSKGDFDDLRLKDIMEEGGGSGIGAVETHITYKMAFVFNRPLNAEERRELSSRITINPVLNANTHLNGSIGYWHSSVTVNPETEPEHISIIVRFSMNTSPPRG
jgi:hypothetical protein